MALAGRRAEALDETIQMASAGAADTLAIPTDVGDEARGRCFVRGDRKSFGRLDLLFNNAGTQGRAVPIDELSPAQWNRVVAGQSATWPSFVRYVGPFA